MTRREKKKRLLIAENEAYRQLLKLEIQNLRIHGLKTKHELTSMDTTNPLLMTAIPVLTSLFRRQDGFRWKGLGALALAGWQLYRLFNPARPGSVSPAKGSAETSAVEEFLNKSL